MLFGVVGCSCLVVPCLSLFDWFDYWLLFWCVWLVLFEFVVCYSLRVVYVLLFVCHVLLFVVCCSIVVVVCC